MEFVAVDVETANADFASICQIGIASFRDGQLADAWVSLINPDDWFSPVNVSIHGIDENQVKEAPTWGHIYPEIAGRMQGKIVVCHTAFDRVALARACERYDSTSCECIWLDSAKVVRRAWPQFSKSGYGLSNVASFLNIDYKAHDALEDARCAGLLLLSAIAHTGFALEEWLDRVNRPIGSVGDGLHRDGKADGELSGEILAFTGALSIPRREAADAAAALGCQVEDGVTRHTTILVVGDQDLRRLAGHSKSSKHLKAEHLIATGQAIRIIGESDFMRIVTHSAAPESASVT